MFRLFIYDLTIRATQRVNINAIKAGRQTTTQKNNIMGRDNARTYKFVLRLLTRVRNYTRNSSLSHRQQTHNLSLWKSPRQPRNIP